MKAPLLRGQPAPVVPFAVINGKKPSNAVSARPLALARRLEDMLPEDPDHFAIVERLIGSLTAGEE
jgi:hypothetical protein